MICFLRRGDNESLVYELCNYTVDLNRLNPWGPIFMNCEDLTVVLGCNFGNFSVQ